MKKGFWVVDKGCNEGGDVGGVGVVQCGTLKSLFYLADKLRTLSFSMRLIVFREDYTSNIGVEVRELSDGSRSSVFAHEEHFEKLVRAFWIIVLVRVISG